MASTGTALFLNNNDNNDDGGGGDDDKYKTHYIHCTIYCNHRGAANHIH